MLNFVATQDHLYAFKSFLDGDCGTIPARWRQWSYEELFRQPHLKTGTWIFQDIERLTEKECLYAARIANLLAAAGAKVLNHPAYAATRYELQRRLGTAGINDFEVYRADEHRVPKRWPVFIRFENNHNSPNPRLLHNNEELQHSLALYRKNAIPFSALLIVEYCGEAYPDGLWRKFSAYRVGPTIIHHHMVRQDSWIAKHGNPDLKFSPADWNRLRVEEKEFVDQTGDPFNLMRAFELANIEFGRADFSFVRGKLQLYEINTNPSLRRMDPEKEKFPEFPQAPIRQVANERIIANLSALDSEEKAKINLRDVAMSPHRP